MSKWEKIGLLMAIYGVVGLAALFVIGNGDAFVGAEKANAIPSFIMFSAFIIVGPIVFVRSKPKK